MPEMSKAYEELRDEAIQTWLEAKGAADAVKPLIAAELEARKALFDLVYTAPKEGVNKLDLGEGYTLKGSYKLERKIDDAALASVMEELRQDGVNPDFLVEWKPSLKIAAYRELTAEQAQTMDKALIIKPSTPTLELVAPRLIRALSNQEQL